MEILRALETRYLKLATIDEDGKKVLDLQEVDSETSGLVFKVRPITNKLQLRLSLAFAPIPKAPEESGEFGEVEYMARAAEFRLKRFVDALSEVVEEIKSPKEGISISWDMFDSDLLTALILKIMEISKPSEKLVDFLS